jgi:hypothetical protein
MIAMRSLFRAALALLLAVSLPSAAHAVKFYVDNQLGTVKPEEKVTPAAPAPVQILFEFQRDAAPNPKATKVVKPWALEAVRGTGSFSEVVETPAANGAVLSIKFNNIVKKEELDKAKKDAFRAGLGFGLFGGAVATDYYEVTLEYVPATGAAPIRTVVSHRLYTTFGKQKADAPPIPGTEFKKGDDAVKTLVVQALERGVNNIVADPAFPK